MTYSVDNDWSVALFQYFSYPMMTKCWAANKDERPSFTELAEMLGSQLSQLLTQETL